MLDLNLVDLGESILSAFDSLEHIEDLVAPAGDENHIIRDEPYRSISVSGEVEEIELRLWIHLTVPIPGCLEMLVCKSGIPHLHIGEHHHLVHLDVVIHQIVDDLVAVGAVSDLTLSLHHFDGVCKYVFPREVQDFPCVSEHAADYGPASALEEHRKQDADVEQHHLAFL